MTFRIGSRVPCADVVGQRLLISSAAGSGRKLLLVTTCGATSWGLQPGSGCVRGARQKALVCTLYLRPAEGVWGNLPFPTVSRLAGSPIKGVFASFLRREKGGARAA